MVGINNNDEREDKMEEFKIEKNIPIPQRRVYPFKKMEIGDSFFIPLPEGRNVQYLQSNLTWSARMKRIRVTTRRTEENGVFGVRVWRIE